MQYSTLILAALATTAFALPPPVPETDSSAGLDLEARQSAKLIVILSGPSELGTTTSHTPGKRDSQRPPIRGPFTSVSLSVPQGVKADYRCKIADAKGKDIVLVRGQNVDTTFGDGSKGRWNFKNGKTEVVGVVCDPSFKAKN